MDHADLLGTLKAFGFGPQFVGFLQVLYADVECLVRLNWTLTEPVSFGRGVRQGCPLLAQLYTLVIEPFLCLLCQRMSGLLLWELQLLLVLLALLLVVQDLGDLVLVEVCQAVYSAASSAQVNSVKSSGLEQVAAELPPTCASSHPVEHGSAVLSWHLPFRHASFSARELAGFGGQGGLAAAEMDRTAPVFLPCKGERWC
ncbi:unnamed protein product [Caretta caretta]